MNSLTVPIQLVAALNFVFAAKKGEATPSTAEIVDCLCQLMRVKAPPHLSAAPHRALFVTVQVM